MKKAALVLIAIILIAISFILGFVIAKNIYGVDNETQRVSFYANLQDRNGGYLLVGGIPENDINHRGEFYVKLKNPKDKNSVKNARGEAIDIGDIPIGSMLRITYDGMVMETYPARIDGVYSIDIIE